VESRTAAWERNEEWSFIVVDSADRLLGTCGIHRIDFRNGVGEIGYWVRTSATRRGIATEATRQLSRWAFQVKDLHRLEILAAVDNIASQRVAVKVSGTPEGILKERLLLHGQRHDCLLFAILKEQ
jgi:RimJ/RimL family protein N-acetyltransferase